MMQIGFSTGSLAYGDFRRALDILRRYPIDAVELSALRITELRPHLENLDTLDLAQFKYISVHAPSAFTPVRERDVASELTCLIDRRWPIILHADTISDFDLWKPFGPQIAIENMDKRKIGRTVTDAYFLLKEYKSRIVQIHISEVNTMSHHDPLSWGAVLSFQKIARWIPAHAPIIVESVVAEDKIEAEMEMTRQAVSTIRSEVGNLFNPKIDLQ